MTAAQGERGRNSRRGGRDDGLIRSRDVRVGPRLRATWAVAWWCLVAARAGRALAAELARQFATDHLGMDDAFWKRLHAVFSDDELVQLALCVGSWLAFGRLNRVFGVDAVWSDP